MKLKRKGNTYELIGTEYELAQAKRDVQFELRRIQFCYPQF